MLQALKHHLTFCDISQWDMNLLTKSAQLIFINPSLVLLARIFTYKNSIFFFFTRHDFILSTLFTFITPFQSYTCRLCGDKWLSMVRRLFYEELKCWQIFFGIFSFSLPWKIQFKMEGKNCNHLIFFFFKTFIEMSFLRKKKAL